MRKNLLGSYLLSRLPNSIHDKLHSWLPQWIPEVESLAVQDEVSQFHFVKKRVSEVQNGN